MDKNLKLPSFLGIGAQKSGTSWLHAMLNNHPDIFVPQKKEVHFFNQNYLNGVEWYSNHFMFSGSKVRGEITPAYALLGLNELNFIKEIMPDVKIIFLLRNPIERAWSHALMEYLVIQKREFETVSDEDFIKHFNEEGSFLRGYYAKTIKNLYSVFPKGNIFIGYYESIVEDPKQLLTSIFTFLKVHPENFNYDEKISKKVFKGPEYNLPDKYREILKTKYKDSINELSELLENPSLLEWIK